MLNVSSADHDSIDNDTPPIEIVSSPPIQPTHRLSIDPPPVNPWRYVKTLTRRPYRAEPFDHAAPISPLRDQDLEIMAGWFDRIDMNEVKHDIEYHLALLYPEPPWEENLDLNFLHDHL
ncbi:MAG: hypothetical protein MUC48_19165 [Leptolyngbya sp. Prado105]|jgi:hypothetical protein|nr:hypothetical protein [Leptolyngbya sp. Prado105]